MRHRLTRSLVLLIFVTVTHVTEVAARYHHIKLRHGRHRRQHAEGYLPSSFVLDTNDRERGSWGPWSAPSSCSRPCGGGVAHQTRQCLDVDDNGYDRCTGSKKRFFSCNTQECPSGSEDFRAEQCAEYNKVKFEGVHYDWIPYTGGPNKCELNCMPRGERFFYRHAPTVTDGTPCDLEKNDVCVEGKCLPVGCDMMLGSDAKEDACRECGGDGSDCSTVNGLFDADDLQVGYIDTLLIPQGATNIVVKEVAPSNNYLAVRNTTGYYYLNGNWRIDFPRSLRFASTIFHYAREPQGFSAPDTITALGPTSEAIYIVLLYQGKNVGVHYEYSIPKKFSLQGDPDSYTWVADEFSECSSTCGGGFRSRKVTCVKRRDNEPADEHLCDRQLEPDDTQACGNEPCPPEWVESEWGPCSKQCGEGGERTRQIKCEQILAGGIPSIVEDFECLSTVGPHNETSEKCNEDVQCPKWHIGPWKPCDHLCGPGKQTRRVTCYRKNEETGKIEVLEDSACTAEPLPEREMACEARPCAGLDWIVSDWSGCDEKCGLTQETRTAHCATQDGTTYPDEQCVEEKKPELKRECDNSKGCDYQWYTSQWSECSANCGKGIKSRRVFCATFEGDETLKKVPDEKCDAGKKFNETEECEAEVTECKGEWFAGPWSKCSKPCGGGDTTRKVICLKDGVTVATSNCDYNTIMFGSESCNEFTCGEDEIIPVEPITGKVPTEDEEEECEEYEDEEADFVTIDSSFGSEEPFDTESTDYTSFDDLMQSDAPNRGDISLVTGSGDGGGDGSGDTEYTGDILSSINTGSSLSTVDMSSIEGSGASTDEPTTDLDTLFTSEGTKLPTSEVTGESDAVSGTTEAGKPATTSESVTAFSDVSGITEASAETSGASTTEVSVDSSGSTLEGPTASSTESGSSDSSASTDSSGSTSSLASTDPSGSTGSSASTDSTGSTDSSASTDSTGSTDSSASTDSSESTGSSASTDSTGSTDSSASTDSSESTGSSASTDSTGSTDSSASTDSTGSTGSSASTDSSESTGSSASTDSTGSTDSSASTDSTGSTGSSASTDSSESTDSSASTDSSESTGSSEGSTESSSVAETKSTESATSDYSSSDLNTDSTVSSASASTELTDSTESPPSTEPTDTTITEITESTSTDVTKSSSSTDTSVSGETGDTTGDSTTSQFSETTQVSETSASAFTSTTTQDSTTETAFTFGEVQSEHDPDKATDSSVSGSSSDITTDATTVESISEDSSAVTSSAEHSSTDKTGSTSDLSTVESTTSAASDATTGITETSESGATTESGASMESEGATESGVTTESGASTESGATTQSGASTESGATTQSGASTESGATTQSGGSTESGATTESGGSTESGATTESGGSTESGATTESGASMESGATTQSGGSTESGATTESGGSTESGATTESGASTESGATTESGGSTESGATTESGASVESSDSTAESVPVTATSESEGSTGTKESTVSGETSPTSEIETTSSVLTTESTDDWYDLTEQSHITDFWTTVSPVDEAITREHKLKKCKMPKKKSCKTSEFGCCYDGVTPAQGPFDKGCPTPKTCEETVYGCCPDGVSPATEAKNEGCPFSHCNETLFGCCPDGLSIAEGNDFEGCKKPCNETEFGCCPDKETPASGKDNLGCCNTTTHGCCPDGIKPAAGADLEGCEDEETTPFTSWTEAETEEYASTTPSGDEVPTDEDCTNSTYGCCPNGRKLATGRNFEGCGVINKNNCTASYFGCCPDGIASALGPDNAGCRTLCENTTYGCCSDNATPAHGPNQEGCCLTSSFGCCPDNISPARGPDFYGCGCEYSRFRCCPDNTTAARGPDNEGCGCQYTPHGCCPNRFTPANGPNFEGCACYTYQFGCCLDGVTIAKGPHNQGCGCENTEFNCCSDERTPAKGPNFAGCTCDASKYGCCPDGIEEAQGENFEGCLKVPTNPGAACGLERDRGTCRDFTVNWFFDTEYGGCSRFWYGGCDGNDNRFKTQEECKDVCVQPKGKDACYLPKISGPCEGYYPNWYYDSERKQCGQFIYGGCLGNANRFESREQCEDLCVVPTDIDSCDQPKESGPCEGNFTKWHFNKERQACEPFRYGGCKANDNNYPTEVACHQQCLQPGHSRVRPVTVQNECALARDPGPCPGSLLRWYYDTTRRACRQFVYGGCKGNGNKFRTRADCERRCSIRDSCSQPRDEGNCTGKNSRWFFDRSENRCMPFYYTGCGGNRNNFDSRDACESDCPAKIEQDICLLPALLGECHNYTQRWFYDSYEQRCRQFYYGGCGGNGNNFLTEQDCAGRCEKSVSTPAPPAQEFRTEFCFLPDERGPCTENLVKWFYDSRDGICKQFQYSGCEGNGNRFNTREECDYRCGEVQDPCTMPKVVGPCDGFVKQFYHERRTGTCEEFEYSGCAGNKNRFEDRSACENKCGRGSEPPRRNETVATSSPRGQDLPSSPICLAPLDAGPCNGYFTAYYYDSISKSCQAFIYGGCKGNANRFQTEEQCERLCGRFQGQDSCNLPPESGPCRGAFPKIFYDPSARSCREFVYGGCDGNANRFSTVPECESVCLHHEEPASAGNDTALSHLEICREPVDIGSCTAGVYKRFYFDEERQTCMPFLYTGCGGNRNNFKTFESCLNTCFRTSNEIDVGTGAGSKDPCAEAHEECAIVRCPYGKEAYVDENDCERCRCVDPCRTLYCPKDTKCAITLVATGEGTEYRGVCRSTTKHGNCPAVANSTRCERECSTDADCHGETKCCDNGCGTSCLEPAPEEPPTTLAPVFNVTAPPFGADPAAIKEPEEPRVSGEEGSFVTMKCVAIGNPRPAITWKKDTTVINSSEKRRRVLLDGSLQIVNLYSYDRGTYVCTADNGLAPPARIEYQLEVTEPHEHSAAIVGEPQAYTTVTLNSPTILHCYAMGWPRPSVTWWRGDRMLPLYSEIYEQDSDYTLLIRSVTLTNLGVYTCQAYNGVQRPASWSVTLQAIGPVLNIGPDQLQYAKYLVQPPKKPDRPSTDRPQYPYRPIRTQAPANQTYAPIAPIHQTVAPPRRPPPVRRPAPTVPSVIPLTEAPPLRPNRFQVPVRVNVTTDRTEYPVGSDVSIGCSVDGYPIPRVLWYKDNELVRTDDRIKISESNRLVITNAANNDSGTYRCEAANADSTSSASVDIRVDGLYIHPDCQDNAFFAKCDLIVKAKYCEHKYYAKFCCRSCTEAGQLPLRGPHLNVAKKRRRRNTPNRWFV